MFNKESCRSCGSTLESITACTDCKEIVLWNCNKCGNKEEFTTWYRISITYNIKMNP